MLVYWGVYANVPWLVLFVFFFGAGLRFASQSIRDMGNPIGMGIFFG